MESCPPPVLVPGVIPPQWQDFTLLLVELHVSPFLLLVKVLLGGSTTLWCIVSPSDQKRGLVSEVMLDPESWGAEGT